MPRVVSLVIVVIMFASVLSSDSVTVIRPEDILKARKVKLKKPDLLDALKKPGLRWAAAAVLAKKGYRLSYGGAFMVLPAGPRRAK